MPKMLVYFSIYRCSKSVKIARNRPNIGAAGIFYKCLPAMWKACWSTGEEQEKAKEEAIELLGFLDNEIKGKKFFGGDSIGLVDIVGNFVGYWFGIVAELAGLEIVTEDKFPNFCKWIDEYNSCSFVKENLPPKDKLSARFKARFEASNASK